MCVSILLFCICLVRSCICSDLCRSGLCRIPRVTRQLRCKRSIFKDPQTMSKVPSFTFLCICVRTMELYKINVYSCVLFCKCCLEACMPIYIDDSLRAWASLATSSLICDILIEFILYKWYSSVWKYFCYQYELYLLFIWW